MNNDQIINAFYHIGFFVAVSAFFFLFLMSFERNTKE